MTLILLVPRKSNSIGRIKQIIGSIAAIRFEWTDCVGLDPQCIVSIIAKMDSHETSNEDNDPADAFTAEITGFDSFFSRLNFASRPPVDAFEEFLDDALIFLQTLSELCASQPGAFRPVIVESLKDNNSGPYLEAMMIKTGLKIV